jgi:hypothetical protein
MLPTHMLRPGIEPYSGCRLHQLLKRTEYSQVWKAITLEDRPMAVKFISCHGDQAIHHDLAFLRFASCLVRSLFRSTGCGVFETTSCWRWNWLAVAFWTS